MSRAFFRHHWWIVVCAAYVLMRLVGGCTSPIAPAPERVEPEQRVDDLLHPCDRCGAPATTNVSEVADESWWRCSKCIPRDVMPRLKPKPLKRKRLETQWVMM